MKILSTITLLLFLTACSGGSQLAAIKLGKKCTKPDANNLSVETAVLKKTNVRLNLLQEVKRGWEVLVSAEVELAVVDRSGSIKKLSKDLFAKI